MTVLLGSITVAVADPLKVGSDIDVASRDMRAHEYEETGLEHRAADPKNDIMYWAIDEGVLIAVYSIQSRKVLHLGYWFADERPKAERMEIQFSVVHFDPATGSMVIQTGKNKNGEQGGAGQPATRPESKSEDSQKPQPESEGRSR